MLDFIPILGAIIAASVNPAINLDLACQGRAEAAERMSGDGNLKENDETVRIGIRGVNGLIKVPS